MVFSRLGVLNAFSPYDVFSARLDYKGVEGDL